MIIRKEHITDDHFIQSSAQPYLFDVPSCLAINLFFNKKEKKSKKIGKRPYQMTQTKQHFKIRHIILFIEFNLIFFKI